MGTFNFEQQLSLIEDDLIAVRRMLHQNPELSMQELKTSAYIREMLAANGIEATYIDGENKLGVTALICGKAGSATIALRADMDALPLTEENGLPFASRCKGKMHACGHDIHTAVLLGTALLLAKNQERLPGNVRLIFQCGEEKFLGSHAALKRNLLDEPPCRAITALHCWPEIPVGTIGIRKGPMMASSDSVELKIIGQGGHAAHPHKCKDPVSAAAYVLTALQAVISRELAPLEPAVLTFGHIAGGTVGNVIPGEVLCEGTMRTFSTAIRESLIEKITAAATNVAAGFGCKAEITFTSQCPPVCNDGHLYELLEKSLKTSVGSEQIRHLETPSMGSEDFAFYMQKIPGILFRLGTANDKPESRLALHNPNILFDEGCISTGVLAMTQFAIDTLNSLK